MNIEIIQQPDSLFFELVDCKPSASGEPYRLCTYVVQQEVSDGLLLFHTLTCELVHIDNKHSDLLSDKFMREHLFAVPVGFDEKKLVREYRTLRTMLDHHSGGDFNNYEILTTTDCNARCFYCYEEGCSRIAMSDESAMKVVALIEKNYANDSASEKKVRLFWYGGEPLYNSRVIDLICSELEKRGVPFESKMTSNGYLFDEKMVRQAVELWKLRRVSITVDGTEEVYNRSKAFIYKESSPYQRVLRNIGLLLDSGIKVRVLLNLGLHNADDLFTLVRTLADSFGKKAGFSCYAPPLYEVSAGSNSVTLTDDGRKLVYEKMGELEELMSAFGILHKWMTLPKEIKRHFCSADRGNRFVILPTGEIGLCEFYMEDNFVSHIDSANEIDQAIVAKFREHREDIELCDSCPMYPQCVRLKMCKESVLCYPEKVSCQLRWMRRAMLQTFAERTGNNERRES